MAWLIIGSTAQYHWFPDSRKPRDVDLLTPAKISGNASDKCVVDAHWHAAAEYLLRLNNDPVFLDPDLLLTLKVSHAGWDVKWEKTMLDIRFLQSKGCHVVERALERLLPVWQAVHGRKKVNLNRSIAEFFDDSVEREHDHELLHQLVAFNSRPMHELLRPDSNLALCSEEQFNKLSREAKLQVALEEMIVTAIERSKLTLDSLESLRRSAVHYAYKRLITSMTTGWFQKFLILQQPSLLSKDAYLPQLDEALKKLANLKHN